MGWIIMRSHVACERSRETDGEPEPRDSQLFSARGGLGRLGDVAGAAELGRSGHTVPVEDRSRMLRGNGGRGGQAGVFAGPDGGRGGAPRCSDPDARRPALAWVGVRMEGRHLPTGRGGGPFAHKVQRLYDHMVIEQRRRAPEVHAQRRAAAGPTHRGPGSVAVETLRWVRIIFVGGARPPRTCCGENLAPCGALGGRGSAPALARRFGWTTTGTACARGTPWCPENPPTFLTRVPGEVAEEGQP